MSLHDSRSLSGLHRADNFAAPTKLLTAIGLYTLLSKKEKSRVACRLSAIATPAFSVAPAAAIVDQPTSRY